MGKGGVNVASEERARREIAGPGDHDVQAPVSRVGVTGLGVLCEW